MERVIGLGEMVISNKPQDTLKTYGLGSCIGITVYSPKRRVGGMGHIVLPRPNDLLVVNQKPGYYAITGIPFLIHKICTEYQCTKDELEISIFGGAYSLLENDSFQIGKKNIDEALRILKSLNIKQVHADIEGNMSRTIEMDILTGHIKITKYHIKF